VGYVLYMEAWMATYPDGHTIAINLRKLEVAGVEIAEGPDESGFCGWQEHLAVKDISLSPGEDTGIFEDGNAVQNNRRHGLRVRLLGASNA
jgi:hypothetical protein